MKAKSIFFAKPSAPRTREEWLLRLLQELRHDFRKVGHPIPAQVRVTCGWPSTAALSRSHRRRIGECWCAAASADQTVEIFISPTLADPLQVAETFVHEAVHATGAEGHRRQFSTIAKAVGLRKPWRTTRATPQLRVRLNSLIAKIGPYPHAALNVELMPHKKDGTRNLKLVCPDCGYTVRTTKKWIATGHPTCPCGTRMINPPLLVTRA